MAMRSQTSYGSNWGNTKTSGFRKTTGKLYKGSTQTGPNKTMTSSIPSKYETVIFKFENKKAFGQSSVRFQVNTNENPGPGAFNRPRTLKALRSKQSYSKKGYGNGFASTATRICGHTRYINTGPGPGQYEHKAFKQSTKKNQFLKSTKAISEQPSDSQGYWDYVPGPGHYNMNYQKSKQEIKGPFKSKTMRNFFRIAQNPPPNRYRISRNLIQKKPFKHIGNTAAFKKPTKKKQKKDMIEGFLKYRKVKKNTETPGPGKYNIDKPDTDGLFPLDDDNKKITGNFRKSKIKNRFGDFIGTRPIPKKQIPGPGSYFRKGKKFEKIIVSGCNFMSETERQPFGPVQLNLGPGYYTYDKPLKKKTHIVKFKKKWLPCSNKRIIEEK